MTHNFSTSPQHQPLPPSTVEDILRRDVQCTVSELSAALRDRTAREHAAAHARWAVRQAEERATLEAEYEFYSSDDLHRIMVAHALHGTMFRDAAAAVMHRRQVAKRQTRTLIAWDDAGRPKSGPVFDAACVAQDGAA